MQQSEDLAIRRMIVAAVDKLPQAPADLRARTLARFRSETEAAGLAANRTSIGGKRAVALVLGFLPAIVAWPLAATLGIDHPLTVRDAVSHARSVGLLSKLLRIA